MPYDFVMFDKANESNPPDVTLGRIYLLSTLNHIQTDKGDWTKVAEEYDVDSFTHRNALFFTKGSQQDWADFKEHLYDNDLYTISFEVRDAERKRHAKHDQEVLSGKDIKTLVAVATFDHIGYVAWIKISPFQYEGSVIPIDYMKFYSDELGYLSNKKHVVDNRIENVRKRIDSLLPKGYKITEANLV